jgi:hypothetical protein
MVRRIALHFLTIKAATACCGGSEKTILEGSRDNLEEAQTQAWRGL